MPAIREYSQQGLRSMSIDLELLAENPLFAQLDGEERTALAELFDNRHYAAGATLFEAGDPGDELYIVLSGCVEIVVESHEGQRIVLSEMGPADFFGEISLFDGGPRTAGAVARIDTEVAVLDHGDLTKLIHEHPHAALDLLAAMGRRFRSTDELLRRHVSRNPNIEEEQQESLGDIIADRVASFGGSWKFIILFITFQAIWILSNTLLLATQKQFDPSPFIMLNLVLSLVSAMQAPVIMMSQNRQSAKDRIKSDIEYEVNLKAELEVAHLHVKVDRMSEELKGIKHRLGHSA
jgi:uncharacterized membrane protein